MKYFLLVLTFVLSLLLSACGAYAKGYTIISDCHYGVQKTEKCPWFPNITPAQVVKENIISTGDNVELKNAEKARLNYLVELYRQHKELFKGRFVSGNHEVQGYSNDYTVVVQHDPVTKILFAHGDIPLWGTTKAFAFRNEKRGQGFGMFNNAAMNNTGHISNSEADDLAAYANQFNAQIIISGHAHVKSVFDEYVNGVRVISVPRGKTLINIP
jgi:predicted phosphodiesterase